MICTRRHIAALSLLPITRLFAKPNSKIGGVQIGVIAPYSFRSMQDTSADRLLANIVQLGVSAAEMQSEPIEAYAGAPTVARRGRRNQQTPEEIAARRAQIEDLRKWRLSVSMDKFRALRRKYDDQGVTIDIVKFGMNADSTSDELDYFFEAAKALGCRYITCEPPVSETKRIGMFAEKHKMMVGYHGHANVTGVEAFGRPGAWEQAFFYSKYNGANIDIGHFTAGNSRSPVDFIRQYSSRITNLHLKDRKKDQGPNLPWGQGDTPIKEVLQLMKKEKYDFMATIELEYPIPPGSDAMTELAKCLAYCREALA